ncbi:MAG: hypothetical protein HY292_07775 [Planctomycetes bacterium]|nr:hypothetical protein [Planctomycetota bacterium]
MTTRLEVNKQALFRDLRYQPHKGQDAVHRSRAPRRILIAGTRFGKSLCASMEAVAAALAPCERSVGWCAAPTFDLADRVFTQIQLIVMRDLAHHIISIKESERRIILRNLGGGISEIRAKTCDNPVSLLGEGLNWLIIDEAARLKPSIWHSHLSQRLIDHRGWALLISTPKGKGWLWDMYMRGQGRDPDYASWRFASSVNPYLDAQLIEAERSRLPERAWREAFGAEFIEGSGSVFRNVRDCATGTFLEPVPDARYAAGLDLAKTEDFTVFVIIDEQKRVVFLDRFHRVDWSIQIARIKAATQRFDDCSVLVDSTGSGEPIYERLCEEDIDAVGYGFTSASKAALINNLALMLEKRELTLPRADLCPELIDELESFEYSVTESGNVRMSAPSGVHDDCVIALALAAWGVKDLEGEGFFEVAYGDEESDDDDEPDAPRPRPAPPIDWPGVVPR